MAKVIIKINKKTSNLDIEVDGIKGSQCTDITDFLAQNMEVTKEEKKSEYFEVSELPEYVENM